MKKKEFREKAIELFEGAEKEISEKIEAINDSLWPLHEARDALESGKRKAQEDDMLIYWWADLSYAHSHSNMMDLDLSKYSDAFVELCKECEDVEYSEEDTWYTQEVHDTEYA